ncbi:MAG: hypothetical protein KDB23_27195 [Planctomycetales bacterium]|nr:hypothetical protein [Planctomycetales bacterium]
MPIKTVCSCGAAFAAPDKYAGRQVKCPKCSEPVRVPAAGAAPAAASGAKRTSKPAAPPVDRELASLLDEVDLGQTKTGRRCPDCREDVDAEAVVCINCGLNLETGKKMKTKTVQRVARGPQMPSGGAAANKQAEPPKPVLALAKMLNQAGMLYLLVALGIVAFRSFQATQANPGDLVGALITSLTESGIYIILGFVAFAVVPFAIAANLVQSGKAVGRILSIGLGVVAVPILVGIVIIKLALNDEVSRFCH